MNSDDSEIEGSVLPSSVPSEPERKPFKTTAPTTREEKQKTMVRGNSYEFKVRARTLVDSVVQGRTMERILRDVDHPHFMKALEWLADRGYGKVTDKTEQIIKFHPVVQLPPKDEVPDAQFTISPPSETPMINDGTD